MQNLDFAAKFPISQGIVVETRRPNGRLRFASPTAKPRFCNSNPIPVRRDVPLSTLGLGTLGIIDIAITAGIAVDKNASGDHLRQVGFRISETLYQKVLNP